MRTDTHSLSLKLAPCDIFRFFIAAILLVTILLSWLRYDDKYSANLIDNIDRQRKAKIIRNDLSSSDHRIASLKIYPVIKTYENSTAYAANGSKNISYVLETNSFLNLSHFITYVKHKVMSRKIIHQPPGRILTSVFHFPPYADMILPFCDGLWLEFGVFTGDTLNHVARWKSLYCGNNSGLVYGFDTFTGLPTDWRPGFPKGTFTADINKLRVEPNVALIKGLFIDTLPQELLKHHDTPVSYVHIDCDIYEGARDVLFLLASRFVSGTVIIFDELFNYAQHSKHEIKALFEVLAGNQNLKLETLGSAYPAMLVDSDVNWGQSAGFAVV